MPDVFGSIQDAADRAVEHAADLGSLVKVQAIDVLDQVQSAVEAKPMTTFWAALAIGFFFAVFMSRPRVKILYIREHA